MSAYDAYVGIGGTYLTVAAALNDGKHNICVLSDVTETEQWIAQTGDYQVTIVPTATVTYIGTAAFIIADGSNNTIFFAVNGGTLIVDSEFVTDTGFIVGSSVTFKYVALELNAVAAYFLSNNLLLIECNITCNTVYVSNMDNTVVTCDKNTIIGNVLLSSGDFLNLQVRFTNNIVYGSITAFANLFFESELALSDKLGRIKQAEDTNAYPMIYTIMNNTIGILGFDSYRQTGVSLLCGLNLTGNTIGTLFTASVTPFFLAFATIINNTISNNNMANVSYTSWCSMFFVTMSLNTFLSPLKLGDIVYSIINDNSFQDLFLGSDILLGSLDRCKVTDNSMSSFTINVGLNTGTIVQGNEIEVAGGLMEFMGDMQDCVISSNQSASNIIFDGKMTDNTVRYNTVAAIIYKGAVDGDQITNHKGVNVTLQSSCDNVGFYSNRDATLLVDGIVSGSFFSNNTSYNMIFNAKVARSTFSSNSSKARLRTMLIFNARVFAIHVINNTFINIIFNGKVRKSVISGNITVNKNDIVFKKCYKETKVFGNV